MTYRATPSARKKRTPRRSTHGSGAPVSDRHRGHRPRNSGPVAETRNEDDEATYARPVVAAPFPLARAPCGERTPWSFARCAGDAGQRPALHSRARFGRVVGTRFRRPREPRNARRHVPTQPIPPQRHVPPAGPATATCDPSADPAPATCDPRRIGSSDMYLPQNQLLRHVPPQDGLLRHVPGQPIPPQRHVPPAGPATATCTRPTDPASATCGSRRTRYCDM